MEALSPVTASIEAGGQYLQQPRSSAMLVSSQSEILSNRRIHSNSRRDGTFQTGCVAPLSKLFHNDCRVFPAKASRLICRNTGFPCLLRFIIWTLYKMCPEGSVKKETFAFLLEHPRRCFTLLFPRWATWWLFAVLAILNFIDLFFFLVLNLGDNDISVLPVGYRILDGLFQVFASLLGGL